MTEERKKLFKKIKKEVKSKNIKTRDEFFNLISDNYSEHEITGGEYECMVTEFKIKSR